MTTTRRVQRSKRTSKRIGLLSCDIDGTLITNDGADAGLAFGQWWASLPKTRRPVLCYNSGRLSADVLDLVQQTGLPTPDFIIGGVGTSLVTGAGEPVARFHDRFRDGWDRSLVHELMISVPGIEAQPAYYQSPYKSSWYLHRASNEIIENISKMLTAVELQVRVIYSSDRDLDVLPEQAGKGEALRWLGRHLGIHMDAVVVAGDSENDLAMFAVSKVRGIVVANARDGLRHGVDVERVYLATLIAQAGVIEGLQHYGLT